MPIYEYISRDEGCEVCSQRFELMQKISDPELLQCPHCGKPVKLLISAPNMAVGGSHLTTESHASKHGFTQYRRAGGGVYEKTAGKGPDFIKGD